VPADMSSFKILLPIYFLFCYNFILSNSAKISISAAKKPVCTDGSTPNSTCTNGLCRNGFSCITNLNICCKTRRAEIVFGRCLDGSAPVATCDFFGNCPQNSRCTTANLCCTTSQTQFFNVRCLDGNTPVDYCGTFGTCPQNSMCTTGNLCCPLQTPIISCPAGFTTVGNCINGLCGVDATCRQGLCCTAITNNACSNGGTRLGNCIGSLCPFGFTCLQNQCCSNTNGGFTCESTNLPSAERCNTETLMCPTATNICVDGVNCCPPSTSGFTCPSGSLSTERCTDSLNCPTPSFLCVDGVNCCPNTVRRRLG